MSSSKPEIAPELSPPALGDIVRTLPQYVYPKHLLSALMYRLTRIRFAPWKNWQIRWFIRRYNVDMSIAAQTDSQAYPHFNSFFTRALVPGARPMPARTDCLISPADGTLYDFGRIRSGSLLQAKAHHYSVSELLGQDEEACGVFRDGNYLTVYLAPMDYHRVHMPLGGRLEEMTYNPGSLFSVNPVTARGVPKLFARNERVVCRFDTSVGAMAVVMVGAVFVGGIETVWHGAVTPAKHRTLTRWRYPLGDVARPELARGDELGRFNMGSTVVVLVERPEVEWPEAVREGARVQVGQALAAWPNGGR